MPIVSETSDLEFEQRWKAWKARGLAHERVATRRFIVSATLLAVIALITLVAYGLLAV